MRELSIFNRVDLPQLLYQGATIAGRTGQGKLLADRSLQRAEADRSELPQAALTGLAVFPDAVRNAPVGSGVAQLYGQLARRFARQRRAAAVGTRLARPEQCQHKRDQLRLQQP